MHIQQSPHDLASKNSIIFPAFDLRFLLVIVPFIACPGVIGKNLKIQQCSCKQQFGIACRDLSAWLLVDAERQTHRKFREKNIRFITVGDCSWISKYRMYPTGSFEEIYSSNTYCLISTFCLPFNSN